MGRGVSGPGVGSWPGGRPGRPRPRTGHRGGHAWPEWAIGRGSGPVDRRGRGDPGPPAVGSVSDDGPVQPWGGEADHPANWPAARPGVRCRAGNPPRRREDPGRSAPSAGSHVIRPVVPGFRSADGPVQLTGGGGRPGPPAVGRCPTTAVRRRGGGGRPSGELAGGPAGRPVPGREPSRPEGGSGALGSSAGSHVIRPVVPGFRWADGPIPVDRGGRSDRAHRPSGRCRRRQRPARSGGWPSAIHRVEPVDRVHRGARARWSVGPDLGGERARSRRCRRPRPDPLGWSGWPLGDPTGPGPSQPPGRVVDRTGGR